MQLKLNIGELLPDLVLKASDGNDINLSKEQGITVVYGYPRTSPPNAEPIKGWDQISGARGCTPQSCAFRDYHSDLLNVGVNQVFGLSTQSTEYQKEVVDRLHLSFAILSDESNYFSDAAGLKTFEAGGMVLLERVTLIIQNGYLIHIMSSIDDPDNNAADVVLWLHKNVKQH